MEEQKTEQAKTSKSLENKIVLKGNLVGNPEFKTLPSGILAARARIAVNEKEFTGTDGKTHKPDPVFVGVEAYGPVAEALQKIGGDTKKFIDVTGKLQQQSWESEGKKRSKTFVHADFIEEYNPEKRKEHNIPYRANSAVFAGNLTADPEVRTFENGGKAVSVTIAYNSKDKNGEEKQPQFFSIEATGKAAEKLAAAKKGDFYKIEGKLSLDQWKDKESGENREKLVVKPIKVTNLREKNQEKKKADPDFGYSR